MIPLTFCQLVNALHTASQELLSRVTNHYPEPALGSLDSLGARGGPQFGMVSPHREVLQQDGGNVSECPGVTLHSPGFMRLHTPTVTWCLSGILRDSTQMSLLPRSPPDLFHSALPYPQHSLTPASLLRDSKPIEASGWAVFLPHVHSLLHGAQDTGMCVLNAYEGRVSPGTLAHHYPQLQ